MKFRILFLIMVWPLAVCCQGSDVLHYRFHITLNDVHDTIYGRAEIKVKLPADLPTFNLDLAFVSAGKGMILDSVTGPSLRGFAKAKDRIQLMFDKFNSTAAQDTFTYIIYYHGIPADGLIISKNKYGKRTFFADNWPDRAHQWLPCVDDPADKASVEFVVTAPDHYQVVANGIMIEETNLPDHKKLTHYKEDVPLPTKVMVIGVADFAVSLAADVNCVPIYSWVFPEEKKDGFADYAMAKDILHYFINYIGPFPYKKLANVQSKTIFGGMENAGAIFYHENSVDGKKGSELLFAHEIIHQWFGDMATEKSFPHLWLSEGFATYLTNVYAESQYGRLRFQERMKDDRDKVIDFVKSSPRPVVDSITPTMELLSANSYQRGGWVLHMLRRQLGDTVFRRAIRNYYDQYKGKNAETKDLQTVFEKASGKKLDAFFKQWLYTPEIPRLDIKWNYDAKAKKIQMTIRQLQKELFQFPLEVSITGKGLDPVMRSIAVSQPTQTISWPFAAKPSSVKFDPAVSLLFDATITEK